MAEEAQPTGKSRLRAILTVAAILVVEAVVIVGVMIVAGGPGDVAAAPPGAGDTPIAEEDKIVEMLVLDAKLPNNKTGLTYLYDTEIYVQVKQRHADRVTSELDQFQNEIKAEITAIWRTSEPHHFQQPRLETLTRKVHALLSERFGLGEDEAPIATKCVIVMGTGFRVD